MIFSDQRSQSFGKKIGGPNLGSMGLNQAQNEVFHHLLKFGLYVLLKIAYNDSFQQCRTFSRDKIYEKTFWDPIWVKRTNIEPKIRFLAISSSLVH